MVEFHRFDSVQILTTKNVSWISSDDQYALSPKGLWSIVQVFEKDLLISKGKDIVRIPQADVRKIGEYNLQKVLKNIQGLTHGKRKGREIQEEGKTDASPDAEKID